MAGFEETFDTLEAGFQRAFAAAAAARGGSEDSQANFIVMDNLSRVSGAETAMNAYIEARPEAADVASHPLFQHIRRAVAQYRTAAGALKSHLLFGGDYWLTEAAAAHSQARAEVNAVREIAGRLR